LKRSNTRHVALPKFEEIPTSLPYNINSYENLQTTIASSLSLQIRT
jgi:hypothetical protein